MKVHKREIQSVAGAEARECGKTEFGTNPLEKCNVTYAEIVAFVSPTGKVTFPFILFFLFGGAILS